MIKGTNNLIYEFVSSNTNEITKVATALHDALRGNAHFDVTKQFSL